VSITDRATRVLLDVDVGIDDAVAMVYLARTVGVEILGAGSIHGNCETLTAAQNALRTLEVCGLTGVPVAVGALGPLVGDAAYAPHVHGSNGLGDTTQPVPSRPFEQESAWDQLVRVANSALGEVDLLALGPLTNLAKALEIDGDVLRKFRRVVIMGGSGAEMPAGSVLEGDWNIIHDVDAAQLVFDSSENITMVGVNVTSPTVFSANDLDVIRHSRTAPGRFVWEILQYYLDFYSVWWDRRTCSLHDPLAAGLLLDDAYVLADEVGPVEVVRRGAEARALVHRGHRGPSVRVITAVDSARFASDLARQVSE
jgi:inosine-uridine nucleoside N-ribohydrolase